MKLQYKMSFGANWEYLRKTMSAVTSNEYEEAIFSLLSIGLGDENLRFSLKCNINET